MWIDSLAETGVNGATGERRITGEQGTEEWGKSGVRRATGDSSFILKWGLGKLEKPLQFVREAL